MKKKFLSKLTILAVTGTICTSVFAPSLTAYASTRSIPLSSSFVEDINSDYDIDVYNFEKDLRNSFSNFDNGEEVISERGVGSFIVKKAANWLKRNARKVLNVLGKYAALKGGVEWFMSICDAALGFSESIDELVYNIVDACFPSWSNSTVSRVARVIRAIMPF